MSLYKTKHVRTAKENTNKARNSHTSTLKWRNNSQVHKMHIGISDRYTVSANKAVGELLSQHHEKGGKHYMAFSDEQRAETGRYAAVNVKQEL